MAGDNRAIGTPYCGAKTRKEGNPPCKKRALIGQKRCRNHGGKNATSARRRAEAIAEHKLKGIIGRLDITPVDDPLTALKRLAGEALAWKEKLAEMVGDLEQIRYSTENAEQIRGEIALFERAMDRCASTLGLIAKLNIDERLAAISEQQAQMLSNALFASFEAAGIPLTDVETRKLVAREFGRHLKVAA